MPVRGPLLLVLLAAAPLLCGCGSKITEANYYRVQHGMTEEQVEDVLGPAHAQADAPPSSTAPAGTRPAPRKELTWSRGGLVIKVVFEQGVVVGRSTFRT